MNGKSQFKNRRGSAVYTNLLSLKQNGLFQQGTNHFSNLSLFGCRLFVYQGLSKGSVCAREVFVSVLADSSNVTNSWLSCDCVCMG